MPVNVNTKIDPWVNNFHPAFYVSLTDKEDWTYTNYASDPSALSAWYTYFTNLMLKINNWAAATGSGRSDTDKNKELLYRIYGYVAIHTAYGTSFGDIGLMDAHYIFNMNSFVPNTLSRATNWYNDMIVTGAPPPYTSARMAADIAVVNASPADDEPGKITAAIAAAKAVTDPFNYRSMFQDFTPTGTIPDKTSQKNYVFTTLNYEAVLSNVTGIQGLELPPFTLP